MSSPPPIKRLPPLNALRAFQVAAQYGSFTKAGEALHVTQGAISRQVKLLEETLGRPLFFRVHQGIQLSESGHLLADQLQLAFDGIQQVIERITNDQRRHQIAINVPPTFATRWLVPRLSQFCALYPYVDLRITTDWIQSVRGSSGHACLVVFDQAPWPKTDSELLMLEKHVMVASPQLWQDALPPKLGAQTLLHILNGNERLPVWERWIERFHISQLDAKPGLAFSTLDQAINAALSGTGVAIVDEIMVRPELARGSLRQVREQQMDGPNGYWFIDLSGGGEHKAIIRLFRDWLKLQVETDLIGSPPPPATS